MKICNFMQPRLIFIDAELADKDAVLRFIAETCGKNNLVKDADAVYAGLVQRENTMSTGAGNGIAFPHTTVSDLPKAAVLIIRLMAPIDFESIDDKPVDLILALIIPQYEMTLHLQLLAGVSRLAKNPDFTEAVRGAKEAAPLFAKIKKLEASMAFH